MNKFVLLAFLEHDRRGRGHDLYPSIERVSWETGLSYSTVRKAVKALERIGILERLGHVPSRYVPRGRVGRFRLRVDRLPTRPAWSVLTPPESRRNTAPVNSGQPPPRGACEPSTAAVIDPTAAVIDPTAAVIGHDSRRNRPRQPPPDGGEPKYLNLSNRTTELERTYEPKEPAASRPSRESALTDDETTAPLADAPPDARLAFERLTPAARATLERDAAHSLRQNLEAMKPEKREPMIQRWILRELQRRRQFGV
jgi:hypothetical protein